MRRHGELSAGGARPVVTQPTRELDAGGVVELRSPETIVVRAPGVRKVLLLDAVLDSAEPMVVSAGGPLPARVQEALALASAGGPWPASSAEVVVATAEGPRQVHAQGIEKRMEGRPSVTYSWTLQSVLPGYPNGRRWYWETGNDRPKAGAGYAWYHNTIPGPGPIGTPWRPDPADTWLTRGPAAVDSELQIPGGMVWNQLALDQSTGPWTPLQSRWLWWADTTDLASGIRVMDYQGIFFQEPLQEE